MSFKLGEQVLLKAFPIKGLMQFGKRGNIIPRYIGLFKGLEGMSSVSYRLALPPSPSRVHLVFHVCVYA